MSVETNVLANKKKIISLQALRALGFLMIYTYLGRDMEASIKNNFRFAISKIKKLYPLHILTMCCAVLLDLVVYLHKGITLKNIVALIGKIGLNVTLLQTWVPNSSINVCLNGVAWFLSVTLFLYFMFPYVKQWIRNVKNGTLAICCVCILILEVVVCMPLLSVLGSESKVYIWFMYCFPVFRLGDFLLVVV